MERAGYGCSADEAVAQRSASMGAGVSYGEELAVYVEDGYFTVACDEQLRSAFGNVVDATNSDFSHAMRVIIQSYIPADGASYINLPICKYRMEATITTERLAKYFDYTKRGLEAAQAAIDEKRKEQSLDFLDMASRYYSDALHFEKKGDFVTAFAALNYAHGWLDAGARSGLFKVKDSTLFTVDDKGGCT